MTENKNLNEVISMRKYVRLVDYLTVAQLFLRDNFFLHQKLEHKHIKPRILGHWGTCPGINIVFANVNRMINKYSNHDFLYTVGTGHGFPAYQSNIFAEGSYDGTLSELITKFSTPYGHPSHLNPEARGVILEGGELGYSLSLAAGSVLDNPRLINVCLIGDGEAETGPLAASWNVNRFINPKNDGVVLPVLHLNGYKISGPTVFGRMSDDEISDFFRSHGYTPLFIDYNKEKDGKIVDIIEQSQMVFDKAMQMIHMLRTQASATDGLVAPRWPVIILKTPKGLGAPQVVDGIKVEGNCAAHQIVFEKLLSTKQTDSIEHDKELIQLEKWLKSYAIDELIINRVAAINGDIPLEYDSDISNILPEIGRRIGDSKYAHGELRSDLEIPDDGVLATALNVRGEKGEKSAMHIAGEYMRELLVKNSERNNFRLFSPDETYSNRLMAIFEKTARTWQWPIMEHDKDMSPDGRVVELLSEHVLFGMLIGYTLTGRYGFFASYESFAHIVSSMVDQYEKFASVARKVSFRNSLPPLNIILSSLIERQDHNGFSHQNPSFVANILDHDHGIVNVYYPADKNLMIEALDIALTSSDTINVIVAGKKMYRSWLTPGEAQVQAEDGVMIWDFLSNEAEPDIVLATCGDYVTEEAVIGLAAFREYFPQVNVRFVNFFKLDMLIEHSIMQRTVDEMHSLYFTKDKPIVFNFHGYRTTIKKLLFDYDVSDRIIIHGYDERGSTTSPFDMLARNGLSRYQLVQDLARQGERAGVISQEDRVHVVSEMQKKMKEEKEYIIKFGIDPPELHSW